MGTTIYIIGAVVVLGALGVVWWSISKTYRRFRGKMVVTCPETNQTVGVDVDATHAALAATHGDPELRLKTCTRWPERQNCGQECLSQIEKSPEDCLVRTTLDEWYSHRECAICGKKFEAVDSYDHKAGFDYDRRPALLSPKGQVVEWDEIPIETLPQVLETYQAVCWDCLIMETFRRKHPEMVVERPRTKASA